MLTSIYVLYSYTWNDNSVKYIEKTAICIDSTIIFMDKSVSYIDKANACYVNTHGMTIRLNIKRHIQCILTNVWYQQMYG